VARGDDRPDSELDLLVELAPGSSLAAIIGPDDDLRTRLGCPVEVITTAEMEPRHLCRRGVNRHRRLLNIAA
jgi:predicted nucleotidyltransferase